MRSLALLLALAACTAIAQARAQDVAIPMTEADGTARTLQGRVCRPATDAPGRLVVLAHGSPPIAADRAKTRPVSCTSEAARWFLDRGFVVLSAARRGYGASGGAYAEGIGNCTAGEYLASAREGARDLQAMADWGLAQPFVRHDGAVVVGQSAGGWSADGLDSVPHPGVIALVSMAGGRGGHAHNMPNQNCHAENLEAAAGTLGRTATTPMLWVYTANDSYFAPPIAEAMVRAFTEAGGHLDFVQPGAFADDGHTLFFGRGGSAIWGPLIERYLRSRGAL